MVIDDLEQEIAGLSAFGGLDSTDLPDSGAASSSARPAKRSFAGKDASPCEYCGRADRQDPTTKGGWANKLVAAIVAWENNDQRLLDTLMKKCLGLDYIAAHALSLL